MTGGAQLALPGGTRVWIAAIGSRRELDLSSDDCADDAPAEYTAKLISGLKGIEVEVSQLIDKTKASQNQVETNRRGVLAELRCLLAGLRQDMAALDRLCLDQGPD